MVKSIGGISVTPNKRVASNFSGGSRTVNIYPLILAKNAIVEETPELEDAVDINDSIVDYWTRGVDAVWIGDKNAGEQELLILNPRAVVNIGRADTYDVLGLGTQKNPLQLKNDDEIAGSSKGIYRQQRKIQTEGKANYSKQIYRR